LLLALTARGDTHLTQQLPELVSSYRQALGQQPTQQIIVDREGLGADFLAQLKDDYHMLTRLRSNQYTDLASFTEVGDFVPLGRDEQGQVVSEVAPARFSLALSEVTCPLKRVGGKKNGNPHPYRRHRPRPN
jgi:hypothetical protein